MPDGEGKLLKVYGLRCDGQYFYIYEGYIQEEELQMVEEAEISMKVRMPVKVGKGKIKICNGCEYEGNFEKGCFVGEGVLSDVQGTRVKVKILEHK